MRACTSTNTLYDQELFTNIMPNTFVSIVVPLAVHMICCVVFVASDGCLFPCLPLLLILLDSWPRLSFAVSLFSSAFHYRSPFLYFSYITFAHFTFSLFFAHVMSLELLVVGLVTLLSYLVPCGSSSLSPVLASHARCSSDGAPGSLPCLLCTRAAPLMALPVCLRAQVTGSALRWTSVSSFI